MTSRRTKISPKSGRGLGHVTPTIFGSTVGYPSDSLASCISSSYFIVFWLGLRAVARAVCHRQSARMSKITNDGLTQSVTGCLYLYLYGNEQWASKG